MIRPSPHQKAAASKAYRDGHPAYVVRERHRAATKKRLIRSHPDGMKSEGDRTFAYRNRWRSRVLVFLGGKCASCGLNDSRVLQIDHIGGGGKLERRAKLNRDPKHVALKVFSQPELYQLLCANCNMIKAFEHERPTKAYLAKIARSVA